MKIQNKKVGELTVLDIIDDLIDHINIVGYEESWKATRDRLHHYKDLLEEDTK